MFDIGFWELTLIAIIALLVVGPQRLPKLAYKAGLWIGGIQRMVRNVRVQIENEIHEYEIGEMVEEQRKNLTDVKEVLEDEKQHFASTIESLESSANTESTPDKNTATSKYDDTGR